MIESVIEIPATAEHKATVIFLHPCGENGEKWVDKLKTRVPKCAKLVLPNAKEMHVTTFEKVLPSWFDSLAADKKKGKEDLLGIRNAHAAISRLIDKESELVGRSRIILGGFSMGGALAIYTGLNTRDLGGVFCIGGYIPDRTTVNYAISCPLMILHGEDDFIVNFEYAKFACEILDFNEIEYQFKPFPKTGHIVSPEMLDEVEKFLKRNI